MASGETYQRRTRTGRLAIVRKGDRKGAVFTPHVLKTMAGATIITSGAVGLGIASSALSRSKSALVKAKNALEVAGVREFNYCDRASSRSRLGKIVSNLRS